MQIEYGPQGWSSLVYMLEKREGTSNEIEKKYSETEAENQQSMAPQSQITNTESIAEKKMITHVKCC